MLVAAQHAFAQGETKIGFVNLDRILRDAAPAQRAQKKIEAEFSKRDQELARIAEQLKKSQDTLEKNAMTMSETDRRRKIQLDYNERHNITPATIKKGIYRGIEEELLHVSHEQRTRHNVQWHLMQVVGTDLL